MTKKTMYIVWGSLFVICAGLGFVQPVEGLLGSILTVLAVVFFLPPAWLLYKGDQYDRRLIRSLSALSLGLTVVLLLLSILTAVRWTQLGDFLHWVLVIVSAPMVCSGYWALSLFGWACLLVASLKKK